jgi:hypothetical protein
MSGSVYFIIGIFKIKLIVQISAFDNYVNGVRFLVPNIIDTFLEKIVNRSYSYWSHDDESFLQCSNPWIIECVKHFFLEFLRNTHLSKCSWLGSVDSGHIMNKRLVAPIILIRCSIEFIRFWFVKVPPRISKYIYTQMIVCHLLGRKINIYTWVFKSSRNIKCSVLIACLLTESHFVSWSYWLVQLKKSALHVSRNSFRSI